MDRMQSRVPVAAGVSGTRAATLGCVPLAARGVAAHGAATVPSRALAASTVTAASAAKDDVQIPFVTKLVTGAVAGIVGTCCVFPIDIVKTRLQNQRIGPDGARMYRNPIHAFRRIIAEEGVAGLYRGIGANLVGVSPEKAIKLAVNDLLREKLADENGDLSMPRQILAGAGAGFFQVAATNPMEIVKIRMQMQAIEGTRTSTIDVVRGLGLRGLYTGVASTWFRDIPYSVLFFPGYATIKQWFAREDGTTSMLGVIGAGGLAGAIAGGACTPQDVIKTRLQTASMAHRYNGVLDCATKIIKEEGFAALYKGALNRMAVQAPLFGIALLAFEVQKDLIRKQMNGEQ